MHANTFNIQTYSVVISVFLCAFFLKKYANIMSTMTAVINNIAVIMNTTMIPVGVPEIQLVKNMIKKLSTINIILLFNIEQLVQRMLLDMVCNVTNS